MKTYRSKQEVLEHFNIKELPQLSLTDRPINPKTGRHYTENSWQWWRWWYSLTDADRNLISDLKAQR